MNIWHFAVCISLYWRS